MYQVYIRHFKPPEGYPVVPGQTIVEEETLMCQIPADYPEEESLIDPKVKNEMGKAGSFEFAMEMDNPWYACLNQITTLIRVVYDGTTIFFGRVLAIDTDMWGKRKVHCEGALAFLLDTLIIATKEEDRKKISLATYVQNLIDSHNGLVTDDPNKRFNCGQVPGHYSDDIPDEMKPESEERKFGSSSWASTMQCLEELTSKYGGYWRVRYKKYHYVDTIGQYGEGNIDLNDRIVVSNDDGSISTEIPITITETVDNHDIYVLIPTVVNGAILSDSDAIAHYHESGEYLGKFNTNQEAEEYATRLHERQEWYYTGRRDFKLYLDWLLNMFDYNVNNQPLKLTENIIDMSSTTDVNGIFTVLIPEGTKNGKSLYLDDIPKTTRVSKVKKEKKEPIGPGLPDPDPDRPPRPDPEPI